MKPRNKNHQPKTAILIGATGLVGSHVLRELHSHPAIEKIRVFGRRTVGSSETGKMNKIEEHLIDFDHITDYNEYIYGDVLFSCLGTTLKKAGSKEAQFKIDVSYQDEFAKIASDNNVQSYYLVSAPGADPDSRFFYSRIKGDLEERVRKYDFTTLRIFRPSILTGNRDEERKGEKWAAWIMNNIGRYLPFVNKYKPIPAATVAKAIVHEYLNHSTDSVKIYELNEIFELEP